MSLVYPWVFIFFIPLYLLYRAKIVESHRDKKTQISLLYLSLIFTLLSLSRPVIQDSISEQKFNAEDFTIAIDASYSMQADDIKPSRYSSSKEVIKEILDANTKNRFSIFAFTSNAMLLSPPTTDNALGIVALDSLNPEYILSKSTSLNALLTSIAKTSKERKKVILFSDGGEEKELEELLSISKENNIILYAVGVASLNGSTLSRDAKTLKDDDDNIVISRLNPILKPLALSSGGNYYSLSSSSNSIAKEIIDDINSDDSEKNNSSIQVKSYKELYYFPLFVAIVLFFVSVTKTLYYLPLVLLASLPYPVHADVDDAYEFYDKGMYVESALEFRRLSPSVKSYYNSGVAYYKAKRYRDAIEVFSQIKTTKPKLKQKLLYNLGNSAFMLSRYDRAKIYYERALVFGEDEASISNLLLIYKLKLKAKKDVSRMLAKKPSDKKRQTKQDDVKKQKTNSSSSKSNQKSNTSSDGSSMSKKKKEQDSKQMQSKKASKTNFKLGYKAYELINKGYTDETRPW